MLLLFQICYTGSVVTGPCSLTDGGLCATSPNYPFEYGNNERCTISGVPAYRLYTVAFDVERCGSVCFCDSLIVNGKKYCGRLGPEGEVDDNGIIEWFSDSGGGGLGWKVCWARQPPSPPLPPAAPPPPPLAPLPPLSPMYVTATTEADLHSMIEDATLPPVCSNSELFRVIGLVSLECQFAFSEGIRRGVDVSDEIFCSCTATVDPADAPDCRPTATADFTLLWRHTSCSGARPAAVGDILIFLSPGAHLKLDRQIECRSNFKVTVASSGEGATLDGQGRTGLFYLKYGCSLTLRGLTLVNGRAESGGVVLAELAGDVEIIGSTVKDCSAPNGLGGVVFATGSGAVSLIGSTMTRCSAGNGGAAFTIGTNLIVTDSTISDCRAVQGGAVYVQSGSASLARSNISNCIATESGGGLFFAGGRTTLSDGTLVSGCSAPKGSSVFLLAGEVSYALPAPAGRWLPNARCEVYRTGCSYPVCDIDVVICSIYIPACYERGVCKQTACLSHRDDCALAVIDSGEPSTGEKEAACRRHNDPDKRAACLMTVDGLWYCQAPTFVQPCSWDVEHGGDPSLLGESLYQLPLLPVEQDFPFACAAGLLGSAKPEEQSSSSCAGRCPAGSQCPTEATYEPLPCAAGYFCPKGTSVPLPCPAGSYSNATNLTAASECTEATPGHFATAGSTQQTACAMGSYADAPKQDECTPCFGGTFQGEIGMTECKACLPGHYCAVGAAAALPCVSGTYANATNLTAAGECTACPAGSACSTGSLDPTPCSPGFFAAKEGQAKCEPCPPGTSSDHGSNACDECEAGRYAANAGQGLCVPCPHPLSSANGSTTCSFCMDDYYLRDPSADQDDIFTSPTEYCRPCPPNAVCSDNTTLASLVLPPGFWRASPSSAVLTECGLFGGDAKAGVTRCAGSKPVAGEASSRRRMEEASSEYCAPGFIGPECHLCAAENHYLVDGDTCKRCAPRGAAAGHITGLVFGLCVACGLAAWAYSMTDWREKPYLGRLLRFTDRAVKYYVAVGMTAKLKILLTFYQVSLVLSSTYSARLPPEYTGWTDKLANVISIDWSGFFLPAQCLGYDLRLLAVALSPVALIALLMIAGIVLRLHRWRAAPAPRERSWYAEAALGLLDLTPAGLVLIFCFVPSISASIFRSWSCQAYTISPPGEELEQVSYMRQDASVECGSDAHGPITALAIGFIVLWPAGSLVLFTSLLAACYKPLQAKSPNALTRATAFLHREYDLTYFWWEAVELARKLVLTGFVLLVPEERAFVRLVVATLICSCYAVALAVVRPYKRVGDDVLAVGTSLVLLLLFLSTNWTTIFLGIQERYQGVDPADVLGFRSLNVIVDAMIALVAITLVFFLVAGIVAARRVAKVPTIRLVSTKQPPELSIVLGLTWHLFNSHIWSTGQDAVKVIKGELQQLLPDIKVFLDVDDLKDIGALEEYIQRSQAILFFLSRGYFRSRNCLREVRSSLEKDKPLVLVQEADPEKGGGTLQALRAECPEDLQPDIFDNDWPLTIWYRIDEFQLISLKIIAEALLLCSPNYLDKTSLPLCVSGELESQSLAFSKPTTLWASPANAGALDLANELAAAFAGLTISTTDDRPAGATHMLLYLNKDSFVSDERLFEQVKQAREDRLKIVMAHENDPEKGGVPFSRLFETTPQELIAGGLYKVLAKSCFPGRHRKVSLVVLAKSLGATPARSRADLLVSGSNRFSVAEGSTSLAKRSFGGLSRVFAKMSNRSSAGAPARDGSAGGEASTSASVPEQV